MTQSGQRRLAQWVVALGASLLLSGCASLADLGERISDVRQGPDGFLYVTTDVADGQILRVRPVGK
mgnify:CR=1 FL=1